MFWSVKNVEPQKMFPCTVFAFEEILYRPQSHLRQVYLETLDSNFTRACCAWGSDREHCGFILLSSECSDGGTWRYMFRPHSNSWTPGPGWVQSNGDGPPFPTVNSEWGEREWQKGDQNGITATWELVLIFLKLQILSSDSDSWESRDMG